MGRAKFKTPQLKFSRVHAGERCARLEEPMLLNKLRAGIVCLASLLSMSAVATAQLARVGPVDPATTFPAWYQDSTGLALDVCLPNEIEMSNLSCLIGADAFADPNAPIVFPGNFTDEFFYYNLGGALTLQGTHKARLVVALEGAFANGPVIAGDQMVFARSRLEIDAPVEGHYIVDHPFGREEFD